MRALKYFETLMYYDGPILFIARDQLGTDYVCVITNERDERNDYLCVPISKGRLNLMLTGEIELRNIFTSPETGELLEGGESDSDLDTIETKTIELNDVPPNWFPAAGVFLNFRPSDNLVVQESLNRQKAIIHATLNPPEAFEESKISAHHLSEAVRLFQRLVKYAYESSLSSIKIIGQEIRSMTEKAQNYSLEIFETSPGSFTLHMQTKASVDLLGYANISRAMEIIDFINLEIENPELVIQNLSAQSSHFVTAYKDLLQFIIDTNTPFIYEWSMPSKRESARAVIVPRTAKPLYEAISQKIELSKDEVRLTGKFTKVDEDTGKWKLVSDEGKRYFGDSNIGLAGITIDTIRYSVICEEVLETEPVTKRDRKKLYMNYFDPL